MMEILDSWKPEAYSEPCKTSKMEHFTKLVKKAIFAKGSILDMWQGSAYVYKVLLHFVVRLIFEE